MNEIKAAAWTLLFAFFGTLIVLATDLVAALENVANGTDPTITDDLSAASQGAISAVSALVIGGLNLLYRLVQNRTPVPLPGQTPVYVSQKEAAGGDVHVDN